MLYLHCFCSSLLFISICYLVYDYWRKCNQVKHILVTENCVTNLVKQLLLKKVEQSWLLQNCLMELKIGNQSLADFVNNIPAISNNVITNQKLLKKIYQLHAALNVNVCPNKLAMVLQQMQQQCSQQKIIFAATAFTRGEYDETGKLFAQICNKNNIPFLDVSKHFTEQDLTYASLMHSGEYDGHYGVKGNQVFAQAITPILKQWLENK